MRTGPPRSAGALACVVMSASVLLSTACNHAVDGHVSGDASRAIPARATSSGEPASMSRPVSPAPAQVGTPAASQRRTFAPSAIRIMGAGLSARVHPMDADAAGHLQLPPKPEAVGWWVGGALAGEPFGSVVLGGHIDSRHFGLGFFALLLDLRRGDRVELAGEGLVQRYRVQSTREVPKNALATTAGAFDMTTPGRLVLITCTGHFDARTHHYDRNLVVVATPEGLAAPS